MRSAASRLLYAFSVALWLAHRGFWWASYGIGELAAALGRWSTGVNRRALSLVPAPPPPDGVRR
jgi:hypothetical protein